MMKDLFKKFNRNQTEVEDLDTGYDSEYYQGAYTKEANEPRRGTEGAQAQNGRYVEPDYRRSNDRGYDEPRPLDRRPVETPAAESSYYSPAGVWEEEDAPAYRERPVEEPTPVFTPQPAPEYLYFTPATYRDCREGVVKGLAAGHVVVVRLGGLEATDVLRLFDYMMGAVLALNAELVRPEATTVVLVPDGVELDEDQLEPEEDEYEDDEDEYEDDEYEDEEHEDDEYEDEDEEYEDDAEYDEEEYEDEEYEEEYEDAEEEDEEYETDGDYEYEEEDEGVSDRDVE